VTLSPSRIHIIHTSSPSSQLRNYRTDDDMPSYIFLAYFLVYFSRFYQQNKWVLDQLSIISRHL